MAVQTRIEKKKITFSNSATDWTKRRDIPLTILAWLALFFIIGSALLHISHAIFIVIIAAVLAYTLIPAVNFIKRIVPRFIAIFIVYVLLIGFINVLIYFVFSTALEQITLLIQTIQKFLSPNPHTSVSPLFDMVRPFGISQQQLSQYGEQFTSQLERVFSSLLPFITGLFSSVLDIVVIIVVSIYFIVDGEKIVRWIRGNVPENQKKNVNFLLYTMQRVVGAYIAGQLLLSLTIGVLVGIGMFFLNVPYAVLLGVLAFMFSFIPIIGTFFSGAACVLLALTKGWIIALIVLGYFIFVHVIEGNILGPRIVGKALGLHPLVSLLAVITGAELYGIIGALFAAPIAGIGQTLLSTTWEEWKINHPDQFRKQKILTVVTKKKLQLKNSR